MNSAEYYIERLRLSPHPEGGYFREIYRSADRITKTMLPQRYAAEHCYSTSIYFLLQWPQVSAFHRIASDEIWHFHDGSPVRIYFIHKDGTLTSCVLGLDLDAGQMPQVTIPAGSWFAAELIDCDSFILMGCTVAPGFEFADFELGGRKSLAAEFPAHKDTIERLTVLK